VLSDFLMPFDERQWIAAIERRWDIVPVVIQDPVWERSFPDVGGVARCPFLDHTSGRLRPPVRLTDREAASMRRGERAARSRAARPVPVASISGRCSLTTHGSRRHLPGLPRMGRRAHRLAGQWS
jgi:hypothetical protein